MLMCARRRVPFQNRYCGLEAYPSATADGTYGWKGLPRREIQGATGAGKVFGGVLCELSELESVTIAVFVANNRLNFDHASAEWGCELQLDKLAFLKFHDCIEAEPTFGEIMGSPLNHGLGARISRGDLDTEIDLKTGPLPLGRLPPSGRPCGDLVLHAASQYETAF